MEQQNEISSPIAEQVEDGSEGSSVCLQLVCNDLLLCYWVIVFYFFFTIFTLENFFGGEVQQPG